ncbi:hypothetical protein A6J64_016410 [Yersinia enterocolitica]|nr:hypothetical protein A6J64_016410 [Yersinia enterocolitica]PNM16214.1 hypothetical protein A6J63_010080 [Yersinia enterocolitica]PNM19825.1 hypothetical protein A6J65_013795 [Yersinia enterocolitica]RLY99446.1 hypothetical protein COO51_13190 [Yersinia enterocolitica]
MLVAAKRASLYISQYQDTTPLYPSSFKLHMRWLLSLARIIDWRQLSGIHSIAAFLQLELFRVYIHYFSSDKRLCRFLHLEIYRI